MSKNEGRKIVFLRKKNLFFLWKCHKTISFSQKKKKKFYEKVSECKKRGRVRGEGEGERDGVIGE